jgi:beta-lactamase class D
MPPLALLLLLLLAPLAAQPTAAQTPDTTITLLAPADLARHLAAYENATFVYLEPDRRQRVRVRAEEAARRRVPASTFKIPHTLIALDSGVLAPDDVLTWDPERYPADDWWPEAWRGDHTLASALEHSVVWFYREVASRVGADREQAYLDAFEFGNRAIGDNPTSFWLVGPLAVSADEQVDFLARLWADDLPASREAMALTRGMVQVLDVGPGWRLLGKTGTLMLQPGALNWLVGAVETDAGTGFFALWAETPAWMPPDTRLALVEAFLADLHVIPRQPGAR